MTIVKSKSKLKNITSEKKRKGEHHRLGNRHYMKTYWPYLPVIAVIGILAFKSHPNSSNVSTLSKSTADTNIYTSDTFWLIILVTLLILATIYLFTIKPKRAKSHKKSKK